MGDLSTPKRVRIYGGGIAGLTVAYELRRAGGIQVSVHEKGPDLGGMARSVWSAETQSPTEHSWRGYGPQYSNLNELLRSAGLQRALHDEPLTSFRLLDSPVPSFDALPWTDLLTLACLQLYVATTGKRTATIPAQTLLRRLMTAEGVKVVEAYVAGPGYGLDASLASLKHLLWLPALSMGDWKVGSAPTSEAWIEPLAKLSGASISTNDGVKSVRPDGETTMEDGRRVQADVHVIALDPFAAAEVMGTDDSMLLVNNQIGFVVRAPPGTLRWRTKRENAFVLMSSPWNITFYDQGRFWWKGSGALWSGTAIQPRRQGHGGKSAMEMRRGEVEREILQQFRHSAALGDALEQPVDWSTVSVHLFEDWQDGPDNTVVSSRPKWVNTYYNEPSRPSQDFSERVVVAGAHTQTTINVWSMESAVESGKLAARQVLRRLGRDPNVVPLVTHTKLWHALDDWLYEKGWPLSLPASVMGVALVGLIRSLWRRFSDDRTESAPPSIIDQSTAHERTHNRQSSVVLIAMALIIFCLWRSKERRYAVANGGGAAVNDDTQRVITRDREGNRYDLTDFVSKHPGGKVILQAQDAVLEDVWERMGVGWHKDKESVGRALEAMRIRK